MCVNILILFSITLYSTFVCVIVSRMFRVYYKFLHWFNSN